jgi:hypothetical protein
MRRLLPAVALAVLLAVAPASDAASPSARAYLDHALALMQTNAIYTPACK